MPNMDQIIEDALNIALRYGGIDGAHHKAWVIDQMCRASCGSEREYQRWVVEAKGLIIDDSDPDDIEYEYEWDEGIAP